MRTQLLIASNRFLDADHGLDKLSRMKTSDPSIQLVRVQVLLNLGRMCEALRVYREISRSAKTRKLGGQIERDFHRPTAQLKIVGRDFGPYDF